MIGDATDSGFEIKARFVGNEAVLEIHGEVDLTTAPQLRTYLDEAIDQGQRFALSSAVQGDCGSRADTFRSDHRRRWFAASSHWLGWRTW
jgi:hypothetical protein